MKQSNGVTGVVTVASSWGSVQAKVSKHGKFVNNGLPHDGPRCAAVAENEGLVMVCMKG